MNDHHPIEASSISTEDAKLLSKLRAHRRTHRKKLIPEAPDQVGHFAVTSPTRGQLLADLVARTVGSWRFIIFQSTAIVAWIVGNVMMAQSAWDPYPFILLNLLLSFQAAYTAPAIMMSQNRQSELDRRHAQSDYEINIKAELEIELLHEKINLLREQELAALTQAVKALTDQVKLLSDPDGSKHT